MVQYSNVRIFLIRLGLGVIFALFLTHFFMAGRGMGMVVVIAILLVFSAYLLESLKKR